MKVSSRHEIQAKKWFDKWSNSHTFRRLSPWLAHVQQHILNTIDWSRVSNFLDVGCGSGNAVLEAGKRVKQENRSIVCGCDLSTGMLKARHAQNPQLTTVYFFSSSAQYLPFKENSFDIVLCTIAFHHFPLPLLALSEFKRVLCPGGKALIVDVCRDQSTGIWVWDRLHRWFETGHVKYYRTEELLEMLKTGGFENVQISELHPPFASSKKIFRKVGIFQAEKRIPK
jgi:ubiquinone/menaquinone biosynthesis C-methylase UbiE